MEPLSQNLQGDLANWPDDLVQAFTERVNAFWDAPSSRDAFDNADSERACRLGRPAEVRAFEEAAARGCCGTHLEDWEFILPSGKVTVRYGFNFGH